MIPTELAPIASHIWQSTLFAAAAVLLTLALRRNHARVRYAILLAASYKFLLPFSWLVRFGRLFEWRSAPAALPHAVSTVTDAISAPTFLMPTAAANPVPDHVALLPLMVWLVWGCGSLIVAAGWVWEWVRLQNMVRAATPVAMAMPIPVVCVPSRLEPGVFGIFRPVLVLLEGIAEKLSPEQLRVVLAHELCHVRRRDNLAAALHMLVEALFWFHPLVRWLDRRIAEERERACDEEVVRMGGAPVDYAETILAVCKSYVESPIACVSGISGSDLKKRVVNVMTNPRIENLGPARKLLLSALGIATVVAPIMFGIVNAPLLHAQSSSAADARGDNAPNAEEKLTSAPPALARPTFEVASIKVNRTGSQATYIRPLPGGLFSASNASVRALIATAYLGEFPPKGELIFGGPAWIDSEHFDIDARAEGRDEHPQYSLMLQSLLENRFKLVVYHEIRQIPVYVLVVSKPAKTGPRLTRHSDKAKCTAGKPLPQPSPTEAMPSYCGGFFINPRPGDLRETGNRITMDMLAQFLGESVDRKVLNRTGLTGSFDYSLEFAPALGPGFTPGDISNATDQSGPPSIFTALKEQLGLKLESQTAPVDVLVIDHIEQPTPN
ncbi:MAG TPA: M56 family metallopeptidase [Candidatus Aquilonibacter sp.]|nr:M56 family metallopeptidase [Candidatus Aquilonibacter sp.]